jgi:hypothetical protein
MSETTCDRCGQPIGPGEFVPLDGVVHPEEEVCVDCVEPWDEVVDV